MSLAVEIYDDFLDVTSCQRLYDFFVDFSLPHSTQGVGRPRLADRASFLADASRYLPAQVVSWQFHHLQEIFRLAEGYGARDVVRSVAELWRRRNDVGDKGQHLHVDIDESLFQARGLLENPEFSSILHLTTFAIRGGATWVCREWPLPERLVERLDGFVDLSELSNLSEQWVRIEVRPGRLVTFDGRAAHFVEPLEVAPGPRVSVPVNVFGSGSTAFPDAATRMFNVDPNVFGYLARLPQTELLRLRPHVPELREGDLAAFATQHHFGNLSSDELATTVRAMKNMPNLPG